MNPILSNKLAELNSANDYECWYLVKQPTAFDSLCYLVSFLKEFKNKEISSNLQDFIGKKIEEVNAKKPNVEISNNYRALRVAAFFGLITMTSYRYNEAIITDTFEEINIRCAGEFEKTDLYIDIIQRQIEKMFISSIVDEEYNRVRHNYRLYPVMLLYKVLLELGRSTGKYSISMIEYRYLVATTEVFEGFLETLLLIKLLRDDKTAVLKFEEFKTKFDNRLIQALKQLPTLIIDRDSVSLKADCVEEVAKKVFIFEGNPNVFATDDYLRFLGSKKTLFELDIDDSIEDDQEKNSNDLKKDDSIDESIRNTDGENVILYGVPGVGKSYTIQEEYCGDETLIERLVFHPDYMYSDFVGQILPIVKKAEGDDEEKVRYEFIPGPFTKIMKKAYNNPTKSYFLIIEEINRGNAPAIFGEIFQLLDRKVEVNTVEDDGYPIGTSEYGITNSNMALEIYGDAEHKVRIPSNLSIIGTMNTSDQNVFTLDTAFQRRWIMRLIPNTFKNHKFANQTILDTKVTWQMFCEVINDEILRRNNITSSEDKRIGAYFVSINELKMKNIPDCASKREIVNVEHHNKRFAEKVLKYLWDDAFKFVHQDIFETKKYKSLEQVIEGFMSTSGNNRYRVFNENIRKAIIKDDITESIENS